MSKGTGTFLAFLVGLTAGAVAGVLFAPDKGSNTRDKLNFQLDKYRNKILEILEELAAQKGEVSTDAREEGERIINEAKTQAESLLQDVESLIDQIKNQKEA